MDDDLPRAATRTYQPDPPRYLDIVLKVIMGIVAVAIVLWVGFLVLLHIAFSNDPSGPVAPPVAPPASTWTITPCPMYSGATNNNCPGG
jgi:hypothetical protein